jgi:hypothetical protein
MYRALALLALPLLVAGCGSASQSAPPPTIDSFRTSYFSGKPLPEPQAQVAAAPQANSGDQSSDAGGPATGKPARDQGAAAPKSPAPPPYKASVAAYIKRYAVDSDSLKLAKIGTPFEGSVNGQKGSVVCVELGGMSDNRTAYLLKDGSVVDSEFGAPACQNKQLQPWDNTGA